MMYCPVLSSVAPKLSPVTPLACQLVQGRRRQERGPLLESLPLHPCRYAAFQHEICNANEMWSGVREVLLAVEFLRRVPACRQAFAWWTLRGWFHSGALNAARLPFACSSLLFRYFQVMGAAVMAIPAGALGNAFSEVVEKELSAKEKDRHAAMHAAMHFAACRANAWKVCPVEGCDRRKRWQ